jgi:hypothetical protein
LQRVLVVEGKSARVVRPTDFPKVTSNGGTHADEA